MDKLGGEFDDVAGKATAGGQNISEPHQFRTALEELFQSMANVCAMSAQSSPAEAVHDEPLPCFSVVANRERPAEFLQCWLDLLRVVFEPNPPGTMYLNSNWDFVCDAVPQEPFRLGYLTLALPGTGPAAATQLGEQLRVRAAHLGYDVQNSYGTFVCMSMGPAAFRNSLSSTSALQAVFGAGLSAGEALVAIFTADALDSRSAGRVHVGTALDASLPPDLMRGSLLTFLPAGTA